MNRFEEKRNRLVYMSCSQDDWHNFPHRFSKSSSYINKVVIKHISYVPRIHLDNIILNYLLINIFYLTNFSCFTFVSCLEDFFVNRINFRINNGRWSDISVRIPKTNSFGWFTNILSIKVAVWLVIRDGLVIIVMSDWDMRELRRFNVFSLLS